MNLFKPFFQKKNTIKESRSSEILPGVEDSINIENETLIIQNSNKLTIKETFKVAIYFNFLWFIANYSFNLSLGLTSVASNNIISATSGLFTLIGAAFFKVDKFTLLKLFSVLIRCYFCWC